MTAERFSYFVKLDCERGRFLIEEARALGVPIDERVLRSRFLPSPYRIASLKLRRRSPPLKDDSLRKLPWMPRARRRARARPADAPRLSRRYGASPWPWRRGGWPSARRDALHLDARGRLCSTARSHG